MKQRTSFAGRLSKRRRRKKLNFKIFRRNRIVFMIIYFVICFYDERLKLKMALSDEVAFFFWKKFLN